MHRLRTLPDYLAGVPVVRRAYLLGICLVIGAGMASFAWIAKQDHDHAQQERQHNTDTNRRQDVADYNLRQAIGRLERLEAPTRADVERLVRRLGRLGSRRVLEQLLRNASPRQLRRLEVVARRPIASPPAPRSVPEPRGHGPGARSPSPPGGASPPPGPTPQPLPSPAPPGAPMIDVPPIDLDGPGPLPPLDLPPLPGV